MDDLNEKRYEEHIREILLSRVLAGASDYYLMQSKKAVDLLICKNGSKPELFFIEVKFHKNRHGRLGFGSGKGIGFQPEILTRKPDYFVRNMRWVIGHESKGLDKFILVSNDEISEYIAGGIVGKKFNNIQARIFKEETWLSEDSFVERLREWLGM